MISSGSGAEQGACEDISSTSSTSPRRALCKGGQNTEPPQGHGGGMCENKISFSADSQPRPLTHTEVKTCMFSRENKALCDFSDWKEEWRVCDLLIDLENIRAAVSRDRQRTSCVLCF